MINRLQQIKNAVKVVEREKQNLQGLERMAVNLADLEYVTVSKVDTKNNELNFS
jgi:hypothetical protein